MSSELALEVEQLGKLYPIYDHPRDRLLQALWRQRKQLYRPFWACLLYTSDAADEP